jgi:phosphonate transport system substrate-binding protein
VAYDPRVVTIWEGFREYFEEKGVPTDYVLFSNYEAQVEALLGGVVDVAWNTNVAYVRTEARVGGGCVLLGMRDVDRDFTSRIVARNDRGISGIEDLRGKRLAVGTADSAQASILPLHWLREAGLEPDADVEIVRFELDMGKHGDTGTSELEVLRALREGRADVGAIGDTTWIRQLTEGRVDARQIRPFWTSPGYCHCNFTVLDAFPEDDGRRWTESLLAMHYDDPRWRELMDQEGLKRWVRADPGTMTGYDVLFEAVGRQGLARDWPA